jgi:hypothetical protein
VIFQFSAFCFSCFTGKEAIFKTKHTKKNAEIQLLMKKHISINNLIINSFLDFFKKVIFRKMPKKCKKIDDFGKKMIKIS